MLPAENSTVPAAAKTAASLGLPSLVSVSDGTRTDGAALSADLAAPTAAVATASTQPPSNPRQASKPASSKFVWVKTQNVEGAELQKSSRVPAPAGKAVNDVPSSSKGVYSLCKKTAAKKPPQRAAQDSLSTKASKYKWVSSAASQAKASRKSLSPKGLPPSHKAPETGGVPKRVKAALAATVNKKEAAASSRSSRYSWKAATAGGAAARRRSSFYWTPDKRNKGARGGSSPGTLRGGASTPSSSPGAFKLRSRMKIIRRSVNVILQKPLKTESNSN